VNKPRASSVFWAISRLRLVRRVRISVARPIQAPASVASAARRDIRFLPKSKKSDWVLRQLTESWASSARGTHSLSRNT
jgi:hypothetical protein